MPVSGLLQMTRFENKATHVIFILLNFGLCSDRIEREVSQERVTVNAGN